MKLFFKTMIFMSWFSLMYFWIMGDVQKAIFFNINFFGWWTILALSD